MLHNSCRILDSLDVLVQMDVLVWSMEIRPRVSKARQDTGDPNVAQNCSLSRDPIHHGEFALDLRSSRDDRLADVLLHRNLIGWLSTIEGFDFYMAEAVLFQMVL